MDDDIKGLLGVFGGLGDVLLALGLAFGLLGKSCMAQNQAAFLKCVEALKDADVCRRTLPM